MPPEDEPFTILDNQADIVGIGMAGANVTFYKREVRYDAANRVDDAREVQRLPVINTCRLLHDRLAGLFCVPVYCFDQKSMSVGDASQAVAFASIHLARESGACMRRVCHKRLPAEDA